MTRDDLINLLESGKIVSITFARRSDGKSRTMACRLGVTSHLKGGEKAYDDAAHNLVTVFDMNKRQYRSIPVENIISVRAGGNELVLKPHIPTNHINVVKMAITAASENNEGITSTATMIARALIIAGWKPPTNTHIDMYLVERIADFVADNPQWDGDITNQQVWDMVMEMTNGYTTPKTAAPVESSPAQ